MRATGMRNHSDGKPGRGRFTITEAKSRLRDGSGAMQTRLGDVAASARLYGGRAKTGWEELRASTFQRARDKPAASALAILTVGIAIGAVLALTLRRPAGRVAHAALDESRRLRRRFPW